MKRTTPLTLSMTLLVMAALVFTAVFTACTPVPAGPGDYPVQTFNDDKSVTTKHFASAEDYAAFAKAYESGEYGGGYGYGISADRVLMGSAKMATLDAAVPSAESAGSAGEDYSQTNNQVAGVDEGDIIKTDGKYIYSVSGDTVFIIDAYPGEDARIISTLNFTGEKSDAYSSDYTVQGLYVQGDYLVVYGDYYNRDFLRKANLRTRQGITFFNIYDISDKEEPRLVHEYKFEGRYFQSRMIGEYIYFVVTSSPEYRPDYPTPIYFEGDTLKSMPATDIVYFTVAYQNPVLATIHAINVPKQDVTSKSIAVESSNVMYASENNLYLTYTESINDRELQQKAFMEVMQPYLTDADKESIQKIRDADSDVLSRWEKENKIYGIMASYTEYLSEDEQADVQKQVEKKVKDALDAYEYTEFTVINKVEVDKELITPVANGKVPGHVNNQFSLDEHNGVLRVATTLSQRWSMLVSDAGDTEPSIQGGSMKIVPPRQQQSTNNVFTLDDDLAIMDSLTGLAEGESIQSSRFIGDKLYLVTFRQVDPFFVIDLSDPERIKELGQLKIPGFSRYLHPYDDTTIIGIGRDASETGRQQGLKISLFDVSDVEHPREIAKFVTDEQYAQSTAEWEHKAFLFSKEKNLLVIPAYSYSYDGRGGEEQYNGAMVFDITKNDINLRGIIDHSTGQQYWGPLVERSLYINELLYTKSQGQLRINEIDDLSSVKTIQTKASRTSYIVY